MASSEAPEEFSTQEVFESAVSIVRNLPKEGSIKPSDELKLKLYAYYKQATHGPNDTSKPRFYQLVELYKWDAWKKLADMSKEDAMLSYIGELKKIMESMPDKSTDSVAGQEFEEILGKKFYDYWFKQWKQSKREGLNTASSNIHHVRTSTSSKPATLRNNDTQSSSNSSSSKDNSSLSLLDEYHSMGIDEDEYKTPTSLTISAGLDNLIMGQLGDQYGAAILRLQQSLEQTNSRLNQIESKINQQLATSSNNARRDPAVMSTSTPGAGLLINLLKNVKSIHWFYLSYPVLIYFVMRSIESRRRRAQNFPT